MVEAEERRMSAEEVFIVDICGFVGKGRASVVCRGELASGERPWCSK